MRADSGALGFGVDPSSMSIGAVPPPVGLAATRHRAAVAATGFCWHRHPPANDFPQLTGLDDLRGRVRLRALRCSGCPIVAHIGFRKLVGVRPDRLRDGPVAQRVVRDLIWVNAMLRPKSKQFLFDWETGCGSGNARGSIAEILRSRQRDNWSVRDIGDLRTYRPGLRSSGTREKRGNLCELRKITGSLAFGIWAGS